MKRVQQKPDDQLVRTCGVCGKKYYKNTMRFINTNYVCEHCYKGLIY